MNELTITIPGMLDPYLNPNRAVRSPKVRGAIRARAKNEAFLEAKNAIGRTPIPAGVEHATYSIELGKAKGEKQKDADNLTASCKAALDGIARALGVDDRGWKIGTVTQVRDSNQIGYLKITLRW